MKKTACLNARLGGYEVVRERFLGVWRLCLQVHSTGRRGEALAARYLVRQGYRVLGRNVTTAVGEIDILAETPDGATVVLVEVKTRASAPLGPGCDELRPETRVSHGKQRKLTALACVIARKRGWSGRPIRFDVIGVELRPRGKSAADELSVGRTWRLGFGPRAQPVIRHHVGAFEARV